MMYPLWLQISQSDDNDNDGNIAINNHHHWLGMHDVQQTFTCLYRTLENYWHQVQQWCTYLNSFSDVKIANWPLMATPIGPIAILCVYFVIVFHGYKWMNDNSSSSSDENDDEGSNRRQQQQKQSSQEKNDTIHWNHSKRLTTTTATIHATFTYLHRHLTTKHWFNILLIGYNISMSALNAWISYELLYCGLARQYNFLCQLVYTGPQYDPYEQRIAQAIWWYFASKCIELLDTIFIILKRKQSQLSFLHVYHHSTMFAVWWVGAKFVPGGSALTGALVNCVVHVLMYAYYAAAATGPFLRRYLWWKKYLTIIQLLQFTAGVSLGLNSIITACSFTRWMQYVFVVYAFSFLVLFGNFYRKTYYYSTDSKSSEKQQQQDGGKSKNLVSLLSSSNESSSVESTCDDDDDQSTLDTKDVVSNTTATTCTTTTTTTTLDHTVSHLQITPNKPSLCKSSSFSSCSSSSSAAAKKKRVTFKKGTKLYTAKKCKRLSPPVVICKCKKKNDRDDEDDDDANNGPSKSDSGENVPRWWNKCSPFSFNHGIVDEEVNSIAERDDDEEEEEEEEEDDDDEKR